MRFSDLEGRRIAVWGLGVETRSLSEQVGARLEGAGVEWLVVEGEPDERELEWAREHGAALVGPTALDALSGSSVLIRSPGVSIHRPELRGLSARGVEVMTATGLWMAERGGEATIAVTGTKGKSTTAKLIAHLIERTGRLVSLVGNIGRPALELLDRPHDELAVIELSSYQIADLPNGAATSVLTNLHREHIDWHLTEARYQAEKLRLLTLPGTLRAVIGPGERLDAVAVAPGAELRRFGRASDRWRVGARGVECEGEIVLDWDDSPLLGQHNALNVCAALTSIEAAGLELPPLPDSLEGFETLPHRLETIATADGVVWVDDSISTTPESALAAIEAFGTNSIILIGGGHEREQDYSELGAELARRKASVIGLPTTGVRLIEAARDAGVETDRAFLVENLSQAVERARGLAGPGSAVLLSPAAPSYNTHRSFIERGQEFRRLVAEGSG